MRTLIAGGGTGGHLTPALAVAEGLRAQARGGDVLFVGRTGGVAEDLVEKAGIRLETLDIRGLDLSNPISLVRFGLLMPRAISQARHLIRDFDADIVVGAAGYVCVPVVIAARREHRPVVLLEQNAVPGKAVRLLSRRANRVAVSFEATRDLLPGARVHVTGNPVRRAFQGGPAPLHDRCSRVLVMGGSQGARRINRALAAGIADILGTHHDLRIVHQCGRLDEAEMRAARSDLTAGLGERWVIEAFFTDMATQIREADLVVMRAGGSSLAEVSALGRPMVVIPYPHAGDHQKHNARPYVAAGGASMIADAECDGPRLRQEIEAIMDDESRWRRMSAGSAAMGRPGAADRVVELILQLGIAA